MNYNNRKHTRHSFDSTTWAKIRTEGQDKSDFNMYKLFDISEGGVSFVTSSVEEFQRGRRFVILEIEGSEVSRKLFAVVRYVKANEHGNDFKIGCEFVAVT